jgi:hypothetical protein
MTEVLRGSSKSLWENTEIVPQVKLLLIPHSFEFIILTILRYII